ncbi:MAG: MFS transporter [Bdellovibrionota bacterium]
MAVALISLITALFTSWQMAQYIYLPALESHFSSGYTSLATLFGLSSLLFLGGNIFWPKLMVKAGTKTVLLIGVTGLGLSALTFVIAWNEESFFLLTLSRLAYGFLASALPPVTLSYRLSLAGTNESTLFGHSQALNFGRFLAPVLIAVFSPSVPVLGISFLAILGITALLTSVSHFPKTQSQNSAAENFLPGFSHIIAFILVSAAFLGLVQTSLGIFVSSKLGLTQAETVSLISILFIVSAAGAFGLQSFKSLLTKFSPVTLLTVSILFLSLGGVTLLNFTTRPVLYFAIALISLGLALIHPNANRLAVGRTSQGKTGLLSGAHILGHAIGTTLAGIPAISWTMGILIVLQIVSLISFVKLPQTGKDQHAHA